ncbi:MULTISPECIES: stage III sporulation protein AG [Thermoactinomyces]|jgi:stage III sporulation protein AG|uniref:Stage III sporulation protein AG n=1 Tax=Thermoactinomyces daqus TaxID=1329516 RepID=A0A7W1XD74_9BACL|nr:MULTISPECIES: stage III sporulation protein AG [Thermoactinomyces]MBA4544534.1 stage III sporulation protein AG [Thermoactinomyces daqus]MBH8596750.1 stage III sporulation protein AG [Thermoactinomyces sp. CICC 10523]MBH8606676.1 stage III sporulation protein AG [Thermoactinomyces sp. CICC 10521]
MFKKWLDQIIGKMGGSEKQKNRFGLIIIMGGVGLMIMILSSFFNVRENDGPELSTGNPPSLETGAKPLQSRGDSGSMQEYERMYETELKEVLSEIVGVDDVSVIVNLDSTEEEVVQTDERESEQVTTERDKNGGNRSITQNTIDRKTAYYRGENGEVPVIVKRLKPKVRGVLVVARGVENLKVKALVIEAIQRTLDVPLHRISVLPRG